MYNIYSILNLDYEEEYTFKFPSKITHLELHPVAILIKYKNITHLEPHPTSHLIKLLCIYNNILYRNKVRPNDMFYWDYKYKHKNCAHLIKTRNIDAYHDGILLKSEIERLKNKVDSLNQKLENIKNIKYNIIEELENKIIKLKNDCKYECVKWLDQIHICNCGKCYNCENNNGIDILHPGRCIHYYKIEEIDEHIEWHTEVIYDVQEEYENLKSIYERELAKKNGYLKDYEEKLDEEYDDWSFLECQRYNTYLRNNKEPKYIY